jgi:hypothetical protein
MIKSLVNPENPGVVSDYEDIKSCIAQLGPNDMLVWCSKDKDDGFIYLVGDYKQTRAVVTSFGDAVSSAKAFLGALTHAERVIERADNNFTKIEKYVSKLSRVFDDMKKAKLKAEAKDRSDNPEHGKYGESASLQKALDEFFGSI